jgi:ATP-binding cassette subfamily B protein
LAFSTYLTQMMSPARMLAGMLTVAQQARAGVERIFDLLDSRPAIQDRPEAVELARITGEVRFQGVEFSYESESPVLRDFNLTVAPGEKVALVGLSGSGKSTVTALIPRFYDVDRGAVLLDGHDVRDVTLRSLRAQIGVAFEESFLFSDTIRANIAYGRPGASQEEVETVAQQAQAHSFILQLPHGYDTVVGERGLSLSGGQRQRVALARAILARPSLLIMDDPLSALDVHTEAKVTHALRGLLAETTALVVAHRPSTVMLADKVALLRDGVIAATGTHAHLLASQPRYRELMSGLDAPDAGEQAAS